MPGLLSSLIPFISATQDTSGGLLGLQQPPQYPMGLAETMQPPEQDPYAIYEKLFAMFQPEFSSPSEDFMKQNRRDAILAAGAAMLSGSNLSEGMGRAGQAFSETSYNRQQDEQKRLDLRSQAGALGKYRGASAAASMESAKNRSKTGPTDLQEQQGMYSWIVKNHPDQAEAARAALGTGELPKLFNYLAGIGDEPEGPDYQTHIAEGGVPIVFDLNRLDIPEGEIGTRLPVKVRDPAKTPPSPLLDIGRLGNIKDDLPPDVDRAVTAKMVKMLSEVLGVDLTGVPEEDALARLKQIMLEKQGLSP